MTAPTWSRFLAASPERASIASSNDGGKRRFTTKIAMEVTGIAKRQRQLLTDRHLRAAKPADTPYRLADGGGLYLYVAPSGVKSRQYRHRHDGRPQTATLGNLSSVQGLAWARAAAEEARAKAATGAHLTRVKAVARATKRATSKNTHMLISFCTRRRTRRAQRLNSKRVAVPGTIC